MIEFDGIHPALSEALTAKGYASLTPVQEAVLDPAVAGADLLVSAQTGSGKTVAFGLAMAADLLGDDLRFTHAALPAALIVAPTRELALQVRRELEWLYAPAGAVIASCVGGMDARSERRVLERGAHIVVGTPGRLCDHIRRGALDISALKVAVLDEADEMLDLGFREDLEFILQSAATDRRTLLFSATVRPEIAQLAKAYQRDAKRISTAAEREQHLDIEYRAYAVDPGDRENAIVNVLRYYESSRALVFCGTRATVNHLTARFVNRGFPVVALSGELSQQERSHALQAMRDGRAKVCIATDVAARGIDLPGLDLVIHADLPTNKETLLHRSGRTGRAGNKGTSALIVPVNARKKAERLLGWANIAAIWGAAPSAEEVLARDAERMIADPALHAPVEESETEALAALMALPPRALAAGFYRLWAAGRSAPEDLRPAGDGAKRERSEFGPSFWISLPVGHEQRAEARWLLPMLCRAGDLTRTDIGAIRVGREETAVQIAAGAEQRFFGALGAAGTLEDGIPVTRMAKAPEGLPGNPDAAPRPARKPYEGKPRSEDGAPREPRSFERKEAAPRSDWSPVPPAAQDSAEAPRKPRHKAAARAEGPAGPHAAKSGWAKPKPKPDTAGKGPGKPGAKYGTRSDRPDSGAKPWKPKGS